MRIEPKFIGTHLLLVRWGAWGRGPNLGYPSISPMFANKALKTPIYSVEDPDPEIMLVDGAVCRLEPTKRELIRYKYQSRWNDRVMMRHFHWGFTRLNGEYLRALNDVQERIYEPPKSVAKNFCNPRTQSVVSSAR